MDRAADFVRQPWQDATAGVGRMDVDAGTIDQDVLIGRLQDLWSKHLQASRSGNGLLSREARVVIGDLLTGEEKLVGPTLDKAIQILEVYARPVDGEVAAATNGGRRYLQPSRGRIIEVWESLGGEWIAGWRNGSRKGGHRFKGVATGRSQQPVQAALDEYAREHRWVEVDAAGEPIVGDSGSSAPPALPTSRQCHTLVGSQVVEIPVDKIHRRPSNRGGQAVQFPDVADLMESIEQLGLSQPIQVRPTSEEQDLPVGHYELVKGERRWTAFRTLRRDTIPAIVLEGLDGRQATIQAGIDNTHGQPLDPIQRLREIQAAVERGGCTLAEAAVSRGIKPKQAEGDLRMLRLPEDLVKAIAEGRLAVSVARVMLPYREIPAVMRRFSEAVKNKEPWLRRDRDGDQELRSQVKRLVQEVTRPLDGTTYYGGYQTGEVKCEFAKAVSEERKAAVKAVEVRAGNKPVLLATDVKAWERINQEAREERQKQQAKVREKAAKQARSEGKAANPQAEWMQDESLDRKVKEWRLQFLRLAIAKHLVPGDYRTRKVAAWVRAASRGDYQSLDEEMWLSAVGELRGVPTRQIEDWRASAWDKVQAVVPDAEDPISADEAVLCLLTQLILWPVAPHEVGEETCAAELLAQPDELPQRLPGLPDEDVERVAEYLAGRTISEIYRPWPTRMADGWSRARGRGPELAMLVKLIEMPNRRQLAKWAKDFGLHDVDVSGKLDSVRAELIAAHTTPAGIGPLKLPAWLEPAKPGKQRRRQ